MNLWTVTSAVLLLAASLAANPYHLTQADFEEGTLIINTSGTYILQEDISFNPQSASLLKTDASRASFPLRSQMKSSGGIYDDAAYYLGFFAAIVVQTNNVVIDLNGFRLEQSAEHALLQRFFSIIELANMPFLPTQGPHTFGSEFIAAKNVTIRNGVLGRSAHHGIHGNGNYRILIQDIEFEDFEVGAVALNGASDLRIEHCTAKSRVDVPVMGVFSAAQFIKPYLQYLVMTGSTTTLNIGGKAGLTAAEAEEQIRNAVNAVHDDVIVRGKGWIDEDVHPEEFALFHNPMGVVDGNAYGFLLNPLGVAVGGFPFIPKNEDTECSNDVELEDVQVLRLKASITEVIALDRNGAAAIDAVGSVFQVWNRHPVTGDPITISSLADTEAVYVGNVLSNAQALVAKAALNGDFDGSYISVSRLSIDQGIIDWIEADPETTEATLAHLVGEPKGYLCNGDSMFHVNKGVIAFRMDGVRKLRLNDVLAQNIENVGECGSPLVGKYIKSHPDATLPGYGGACTRGYSFSGSQDIQIKSAWAMNVRAKGGSAIGFDFLTNTQDVDIKSSGISVVDGGWGFVENDGPNEANAYGFWFRRDVRDVKIRRAPINDLSAYGESVPIRDDSIARVKIAGPHRL